MNIEFQSLLPFCVPLAIVTTWIIFFISGKVRLNSTKLVAVTLLRLLTVLAITTALCNPQKISDAATAQITLLLDVSDSMDPSIGDDLLTRAKNVAEKANLSLQVVPFAKRSSSLPVSARDDFRSFRRSWEKLDVGGTSLESPFASVEGRGKGGDDKGAPVLLISDGWDTAGENLSLPAKLRQKGLTVFPLVPADPRKASQEFKISELYAPLVAPAKKSVDVRVSLLNSSLDRQMGRLKIVHQKKVIYDDEVTIEGGKELIVTAQSDSSAEGIKEITATLTPTSQFRPSSKTIFLSGEDRSKVLLINGVAEDGRFLKEIMQEQAYRLTSVLGQNSSSEFGDLNQYEAVILNNVALDQLPDGAANKIASYTRAGGGLMMVGGNKSFGLGGYLRSPVEEVLPVNMLPPQTIEKRLNIAVSLVVDKSGSMGSGNKLDFAKDAAREVIRSLKDDDYVGVIGFDSAPWIVVKMGLLAEIRENAIERVGRLFPAQKTNLIPAIDEARRGLERAPAGRKHIIVLTDGELPDGGPFYIEITKQLRLLGITLSTVLLGGDDPNLLRQMAEAGGGAFYQTLDASTLPRIFLTDIKATSGEKTMKEQGDLIIKPGPGSLKSTTVPSFPSLKGYVGTRAKPDANLELVLSAEGKAEPLLVSWKIGKGKSIAFTSDLNGRWSRSWAEWERLPMVVSEFVDSIRPEEAGVNEPIKFDLKPLVEGGILKLDLSVYTEGANGEVKAQVIAPDNTEKTVVFESISRGHFVGTLPKATAGKYEIRTNIGGRKLAPVAFTLSGDLFGEKKDQGFNMPLLSSLAGETSGAINPSTKDLVVPPKLEKSPLAHFFLLAGCLLALLEIFSREMWNVKRKRKFVSSAS